MKKIIVGLSLMLPLMVQAQERLSTTPVGAKETPPGREMIPTFVYVEQMPEFQGDLQAFLRKNLVYPDSALHERIEGTVHIKFVVKDDGSISDPQIMRSLSPDCDREALRVIGLMPKWKPGKQNGASVNVFYNLPISFKLEN
ncbi:energy transducer TonB [Rurimicrobium arvi]|uniref:TonB C-terminal domain-containing protein n=1 Tax=Rurimicrobium arvi TaxID=2049916 RepID=A0ABP8N0Z7_9BACT